MKANVNLKNMFAAIAAPFTAGMQAAMELASKQEEQRKAAKDKGAGGADKK